MQRARFDKLSRYNILKRSFYIAITFFYDIQIYVENNTTLILVYGKFHDEKRTYQYHETVLLWNLGKDFLFIFHLSRDTHVDRVSTCQLMLTEFCKFDTYYPDIIHQAYVNFRQYG
jgi:hypothetical protein